MIRRKLISREKAVQYCGINGYVCALPLRLSLRAGEHYSYPIQTLPPKLILEETSPGTSILPSSLGLGVFYSPSLSSESYRHLLLPLQEIEEVDVKEFKEVAEAVLSRDMPGRYWINHESNIVYLYYPEITITNTIGTVHKVYDLLVRLGGSNECLSTIHGTRVSYSEKEIEKQFIHPHLQRSMGGWNGFCLGDGTAVKKFVTLLKAAPVTEDDFGLFIAQLERYLSWESMEGKPYISINELVSQREISTSRAFLSSEEHNRLAKMFLQELTPDMLTRYGSEFILNPASCATKLFEIEKAITEKAQVRTRSLQSYDLNADYYVSDGDPSGRRSLPSWNSEMAAVIEHLHIQPRIIDPVVAEDSRIIKRLGSMDLWSIFQGVNDLLLNGNYNNG